MTEGKLQPLQTVLLNIDMQHFFVEGSPDGHLVMERINRLAKTCRRAGIIIIHTIASFQPNVPNVQEAITLHPGLTMTSNDLVFEKCHFSAFHDSALETILHARGIDTIIITGIRTNVCCLVTAWDAIARGFKLFFLRDGTATKQMGGVAPEILQMATCATFDHLFGNVITVEQMIERIEMSN